MPIPWGDLLKSFGLTFGVTWTCFISVAVAIPAEKPLGYVLVLMGAYVPSFVALALTAWRERQQGVRAILRHVVHWQVAKRWYLFAVCLERTLGIPTTLTRRWNSL
jgi:hypothetical protein